MVFKKGLVPWNKGKTGIYSEETRRKMSLVRKGKPSFMKGKKHSEETLLKLRKAHKKLWQNPEYRKKTSEAHKGKPAWWNKGRHHSEEAKRKMSEAHKGQDHWTGKHHSEESKRKMSEAHLGQIPWIKGKHWSEEIRKKLSESHKGKPAWNKGKTGIYSEEVRKKHSEFMKDYYKTHKNPKLGKKGYTAWNKGKHTGLIPWNKGKIGTLHHSEEAKLKIKEARAKQIFPLKDSSQEIKVQNFLKQLGVEFKLHKLMNEIKHSYQCDIFVPSMNLVIECDGDYWHGNTNNPRFKILNKSQTNTKELDNIRTKELQEKGFNILRLWESDIEKMNLNDFIGKIRKFKENEA